MLNCWLNHKFVNNDTDAVVKRRFNVSFMHHNLNELKLATVIYWGDRERLTDEINKHISSINQQSNPIVELQKLCFLQKIYRETKKIIKPNFLENGIDNAA